jgi:capsular exopolysaccharide synthesis family protein
VSTDQIASILWRRRRIFLLAFAACVASVVAATLTLPKTYKATATLLVGSRNQLVTSDLLDQITRTYATLAGNPNVADEVVNALPQKLTRDKLLQKMSFAPVENTSLLQISAEARRPAEARQLANTYASVFVGRVRRVATDTARETTLQMSEPAVTPTSPAKPNPPLYVGLGTLLALLIAFAVALLRERLDTRLRVAPEDDALLGQPILARVPRFADRDRVVSREVNDRFALLKTNIDFLDDRPLRVIMVTSGGVGEGKSTVSGSLAAACAADGERVVLIEADLRRPGLEQTISLHEGGVRSDVGLTNYLVGAADERDVIFRHGRHARLDIVWSGPHPPNPSALLGSQRLDMLLNVLRDEYDRLIIDTAPIAVAADSSILASRVDGVLFVVDETRTKRPEAQAGLNQLAKVRARVLGVVLNRTERELGEPYYYYRREHAEPVGPAERRPARSRRRARV